MTPDPFIARLRFGRFELDEAEARLTGDGAPVTMPPKPFAVLCALVRERGHLLTTNALLDKVWGHRFVTDSVLKTAVSEVRAALGDDARQPRFIQTVARRGYRFIAATVAMHDISSIPGIDFSGAPSFDGRARPIWSVDAPACAPGDGCCQPVYATDEEVRRAYELRLQVRARLLRYDQPACEARRSAVV
jgi:DNA-binding winged helix-turn-helix (wHTH) protein